MFCPSASFCRLILVINPMLLSLNLVTTIVTYPSLSSKFKSIHEIIRFQTQTRNLQLQLFLFVSNLIQKLINLIFFIEITNLSRVKFAPTHYTVIFYGLAFNYYLQMPRVDVMKPIKLKINLNMSKNLSEQFDGSRPVLMLSLK